MLGNCEILHFYTKLTKTRSAVKKKTCVFDCRYTYNDISSVKYASEI